MHPSVNHSIAHHTEVLAKITESPTTSLPPGLVELDVMGELAGSISLRRHGRQLNVSLKQMLPSMLSKAGVVLRYQRPREPETSYVLSALSCGSGPSCRAQSLLAQAFARESEPGTGLHFSSADRLVNYKLMEIYEGCIAPCGVSFDQKSWCGCGQKSPNKDGTLYDMAIRRASGYFLQQGT